VAVELDAAAVGAPKGDAPGDDEAVHEPDVVVDDNVRKGGEHRRSKLTAVVRVAQANGTGALQHKQRLPLIIGLPAVTWSEDKRIRPFRVVRASLVAHKHAVLPRLERVHPLRERLELAPLKGDATAVSHLLKLEVGRWMKRLHPRRPANGATRVWCAVE